MSLKAKIEAVIYAAEEPVTLAQLAGLFQADVVEVLEARKSAEAAATGERSAEEDVITETVPVDLLAVASETVASDGTDALADSEAAVDGPDPAEVQKQAQRQRDREIRDELRSILDALVTEYAQGDRGMDIREIAGGYRVATKPEYHDAVRGFVKSLKPPMKLSLQALETLAVIAYKQPVTAPEVSEIRGVDSGGVLGSLVSRKLITTAGRKQVIGRPILYKTTKEFLLRFGLKDLNELPSIEEFEKMAGELAETDEAIESGGGPEIARPELPFQPNADEVDEALAETAAEMEEEPVDGAVVTAAIEAVNVSGKGGADGGADLPGIKVEPEVKATDLVETGSGDAPAHQPGEGN
jgi:segregation and condensation protein B